MKHLTEEEMNAHAGGMWCPLVRRENVSPSLHGLEQIEGTRRVTYSTNCIGTRCMMFRRVVRLDLEDATPLQEAAKVTGFYCGLAGKP